jgi:hypothetical protein
MTKAPERRSPSKNPINRTPNRVGPTPMQPSKDKEEVPRPPSTKWQTCKGCMGYGGMGGGCARCGGTGYL